MQIQVIAWVFSSIKVLAFQAGIMKFSRRHFLACFSLSAFSVITASVIGVKPKSGVAIAFAHPIPLKLTLADIHKEDFDTYLNSEFGVHYSLDKVLNVTLIEISENKSDDKLEQFSLVFQGPQQQSLHQDTYCFEHPQLGCLDLFIALIGQDQAGLYYEAVFNRLKA